MGRGGLSFFQGRASMGGMARTVYCVAASVDGFISDAQDSGEWLRRFDGARNAEASLREVLDAAGAVAMGAGAYRSFLASPGSWPYGTLPAWVFTHREFPGIPGADITFVRGDVAEFHPDIQLDAGSRDILLAGGGNLAGQFMDYGLVDEMVLTVIPVALGSGCPMLPVQKITAPAALVGERSLGGGAVQLHYDFRG